MLLKINGIPTVCKHLTDQANCEAVVKACGPDTLWDVCTIKMIYQNLTYGGRVDSPLLMVKDLYGMFDRSREYVFHKTMSWGHDTLHGIVEDTLRNIGG